MLSLALPVDLNLNLYANSVSWQKKTIKNINIRTVFSQNAVTVPSLSIGDMEGASVNVTAGIKDIRALSGMDSRIDINAPDIRALAQWFGVDARGPGRIMSKKRVLKPRFSGTADLVDMTTNISAMGGEVIASGRDSGAT